MDDNLSWNSNTNVLTVGPREGVVYKVRGVEVEGDVDVTKSTTLKAYPLPGYVFESGREREWTFEPTDKTPEKTENKDSKESDDNGDADPVETSAGGPAQSPAQGSGAAASALPSTAGRFR